MCSWLGLWFFSSMKLGFCMNEHGRSQCEWQSHVSRLFFLSLFLLFGFRKGRLRRERERERERERTEVLRVGRSKGRVVGHESPSKSTVKADAVREALVEPLVESDKILHFTLVVLGEFIPHLYFFSFINDRNIMWSLVVMPFVLIVYMLTC